MKTLKLTSNIFFLFIFPLAFPMFLFWASDNYGFERVVVGCLSLIIIFLMSILRCVSDIENKKNNGFVGLSNNLPKMIDSLNQIKK